MAIRLAGMNSGLDTDAMIVQLNKSYQTKIDNVKKQQSNVQYQIDAWNDLNSKIYSYYSNSLSNSKFKSNFNPTKVSSSSDALKVNSTNSTFSGNHTVEILSKAQVGYITGEKKSGITNDSNISELGLSAGTYKFNNKEITVDDSTKVSDLVNKLKETGVSASFDNAQKRFYISAKESGLDNDFDFSSAASDSDLLKAIGTSEEKTVYLSEDGGYYRDKNFTEKIEDKSEISDIRNGNYSVRISGQDSEILLDGVSYKSSSNNIKVAELDMTINDVSKGKINVSATKDYSKTVDAIKKLVNDYNDIMKEMGKAYSTSRDKYSPLTDDEKDKMSDSQIKKWEDKLKSSALYKDNTLNSFMNNLRRNLTSSIQLSDGRMKSYNEFGISSNSYLGSSAEDRNLVKLDENKLLKALQKDEEGTIEFFSSLGKKMYDGVTNDMNKNSNTSSKFKVYNDKALAEKSKAYDKDISKIEEKMNKEEDKYIKQFAAMEKALAVMNSQTASISSLFNFRA